MSNKAIDKDYLLQTLKDFNTKILSPTYQKYTDFASDFSSSTTYAVGDYVTYQGGMYRFTSAHTGAWSNSHVVSVKISDEFDEWTGEQTLAVGATSATFTGLNSNYAYDVYFDCADGYAPPTLTTGLVFNGTNATATFSAVTSEQAGGASGTRCKISLRIVK